MDIANLAMQVAFRKNAEEEMAKAKAAGLDPYLVLIDIPKGGK